MKNRKSMNPNVRRILLCALLCATVSVTTALTSCNNTGEGKETDSDTEKQSQSVAPVESDAPAATTDDHVPTEPEMTEPVPPETEPLPVETEPLVTEPVETDPPETDPPETDPPVTEPTEDGGALADLVGMTDSGTFYSEQSENLVLRIDWEYEIRESGIAEVSVDVGVSHYRLFAREKIDWGAVQADGVATLFTTPVIEHDDNTPAYTPFYSYVYTTERSETELEASWKVLGTYGGVEIDSLTAGGTIVFGEK